MMDIDQGAQAQPQVLGQGQRQHWYHNHHLVHGPIWRTRASMKVQGEGTSSIGDHVTKMLGPKGGKYN